MASDEQSFECNTPSVIFERFADETILINLDAGHYYSMDPIGAVIWALVNRGLAVDRIVELVSAHYAAGTEDVSAGVRAYVARMREEKLIRPRRVALPTTAVDEEISVPSGTAFTRPVLAKYDDMEEMLLLDPVHDVTEAGWPEPAPTGANAGGTTQIEDDDVSTWPSLDDES
jgi:hypothetical protein